MLYYYSAPHTCIKSGEPQRVFCFFVCGVPKSHNRRKRLLFQVSNVSDTLVWGGKLFLGLGGILKNYYVRAWARDYSSNALSHAQLGYESTHAIIVLGSLQDRSDWKTIDTVITYAPPRLSRVRS